MAGRCNRHGLRNRASVKLIRLINENEQGTATKAFCEYIYHEIALQQSRELLLNAGASVAEEQVGPLVEDYFQRLAGALPTGVETTQKWARFQHDDLNIHKLLRDQFPNQISLVVKKLDPELPTLMATAYENTDRWKRRRMLRELGARIALVTVTAWTKPSFRPEAVADPFPNSDTPSFWFLHDDFYHAQHYGLQFDQLSGTQIL